MKRFLWLFSGIVAALLIVLASSGSNVFAEPALPTGAGHTAVSTYNVYEGYNGNQWFTGSYKIGEYLNGGTSTNANNEYRISGIDLNLGSTVPSGSYSVFTLQIGVGGYFTKSEFNGFVSNNSFEVVIVDMQVQEKTSQSFVVQFTVYNYQPMQRVSLRSQNGLGIGFIFSATGSNLNINVSDLSWVTALSGTTLNNSLGSIKGDTQAMNDKLQQILNNGITANVDNSGVVSQLQQSQQQAHTDAQNTQNAINNASEQAHQDSQAQLEEQKKANEIAEEQKNFVTDTSTPEASDIANSSTIPSSGLLPDGPLDSILLLPVNILNSIIQSLGGTCSPIEATLPFVDEKLVFPCFNTSVYQGSFEAAGNIVGAIGSAFILYGYFKHLYKKVDRAVSMETTDEDEWGIL